MDEKTIRALEYDKILAKAASFASSKRAKDVISALRPFDKTDDIKNELDRVEEADKILFEYATNPALNFDDISDALKSATVLSMLNMGDLLKICRVLKVARTLQGQILNIPDNSVEILKNEAKTIYTNKKLEDDIDRAIISDTEMSDRASEKLSSLRKKIRQTGENIKAKLNSYVNSPSYSKYMQDNIVTVREDRYVVPVKCEYKSMIPGLIHDQSASGATLYVEPFAIVEMNNELKQLTIEEQSEIARILREFTARICGEVGFLQYTFDVITGLDIVFAKAYYANSIRAVKPIFNERGYVNIQKGRHPLIPENKVVANDIYIGKDFNMLFLTGPNTGGKTVCLKLIGLIELMGMTGMYVPAVYAELAKFDNIFSDIGDEQSIEQNLSTFSSHMTNVVRIIDGLSCNCLVLLDELGAGTDPTEGAALALGISEYIMKLGVKAVITTHYNELKEFAVVTSGAENASMDFDATTYSPTYRLIIGTPGASNALLIAEKLGLKKEIVEKAKSGISEQKFEFENILLSLEKSRKETEDNLAASRKAREDTENIKKEAESERQNLFEQRERLNTNVKKETKRLVEESMADADEIIDRMKALLDAPTDADIFEARRLRKSLTKYAISDNNEFTEKSETEEGEIGVGDRVLVNSLNAEGDVTEINAAKTEAKVRLGKMSCNVKTENLTKLKAKETKREPPRSKQTLHTEPVPSEINLIGKTSLEAETELDYYMEKAYRAGLHEVRIIHGYGEGILRKTVQKYLKNCKTVAGFRDGEYTEGSKGVTVACFK
jgi:DNA mismatch repair protein MutS2